MTEDIKLTVASDDHVTAIANTTPTDQRPVTANADDAKLELSKKRQGPAQHDPGDVSPKRPLNALVHGVYAKDLVLPWESEADLIKLYQAYREEFNVEGSSEEEVLLDVVGCDWLQRRVAKMAQMGFQGDPDVLKTMEANGGSWPDLLKALRNDPQSKFSQREKRKRVFEDGLQKVFELESERFQKAQENNDSSSKVLNDETSVSRRLVACLSRMATNEGVRVNENTEAEAVEKAYDLDRVAKVVKLQASIAARKDKAMARLVAIKEFKRQYGRGTPLTLPQTSGVPLVPDKKQE